MRSFTVELVFPLIKYSLTFLNGPLNMALELLCYIQMHSFMTAILIWAAWVYTIKLNA